ncbi:hypothetical protein [Burkholderia gladioli]|uniref:hypothetical protein n=1 Tax=Burkholderia gladioli TaxID=28095 RepID=UPI00163FD051|nr:hypothetical protein [Burkholderia gladioli]
MNALDIWHECRRWSITLQLNGDRLHYDGPPASIAHMLPKMKACRDDLLRCVVELDGALYADGPYLPWGPPVDCAQLKAMQRELFEVVDELAKLERWDDDAYDLVVGAIERQPISTLRPDLAHFRERLRSVQAEIRSRRPTANHARRHA